MSNNQQAESVQTEKNFRNVIKIDEAQVKDHLGGLVRKTVEETLNDMLDAEAQVVQGILRFFVLPPSDLTSKLLPGPRGRQFFYRALLLARLPFPAIFSYSYTAEGPT